MRRIPKPDDCRSDHVGDATRQRNLRTFPRLLKFGLRVARASAYYDAMQGNPLLVKPIRVDQTEKEALHYLFNHPPKRLAYIEEMRTKFAGETCPMCGGQDPVTLDHYLPRADYAEFTLLPYNLVPACSCNNRRGNVVANHALGRRILHPYYDGCLDFPLFLCDFDPIHVAPVFTVRILLPSYHPDVENISFHIENVVLKTNFRTFIAKRWQKAKLLPDDMLAGNRNYRTNPVTFRRYLAALSQSKSRLEGPNAWEAVFFRSLAAPGIAQWLFTNT